jgi:hypothetical protein
MFKLKLGNVYVGAADERVRMTHYCNGAVFNQTDRFSIQKGCYIQDIREGWEREAQDALRNGTFSVDKFLYNMHHLNVKECTDAPRASSLVENLIQHLIVADVDGDEVLKHLKACGFDVKGWKLTRLYLGGWNVTRGNLQSNLAQFIEWVSSNEPEPTEADG